MKIERKILLGGGVLKVDGELGKGSGGTDALYEAIKEWADKMLQKGDKPFSGTFLTQTIAGTEKGYYILNYSSSEKFMLPLPEELIDAATNLFDGPPEALAPPPVPIIENEDEYKKKIQNLETEVKLLKDNLYEVGEQWGEMTRKVMAALGFELQKVEDKPKEGEKKE